MLDEAQALAGSAKGGSVMASLRAVLQKRKRDVLAVFTGSSQDGLAAMIKRVSILSGTGGDYPIEDPLLVDYLLANGPDRLL